MTEKCAQHLSQFALSIDTVDDTTYQNVRRLVESYFLQTLKASFFAVGIDGVRVQTSAGFQPALQTLWSNRPLPDVVAIYTEAGQYTGVWTFAYDKDIRLWITAEDDGCLADKDATLVDAWSNVKSLPAYIAGGESDARTAAILPLAYGGRVFGVLVLEFEHSFECTTSAKDGLATISAALARVIWLHQTTKTRLEDTHTAFGSLEELFSSTKRAIITKPCLFLASAKGADAEVTGKIIEVLNEFNDELDVIYWKDIAQNGNINEHILEAISSSQFGVCYLSEKMPNEPGRFVDNPNVLFEAGMLHGLTKHGEGTPTAWIPVREEESRTTPTPFDFSQERRVLVPRNEQGQLNGETFTATLRRQIQALLGNS